MGFLDGLVPTYTFATFLLERNVGRAGLGASAFRVTDTSLVTSASVASWDCFFAGRPAKERLFDSNQESGWHQMPEMSVQSNSDERNSLKPETAYMREFPYAF
jgi:hypothetical protein